jgi:hypothetical protein
MWRKCCKYKHFCEKGLKIRLCDAVVMEVEFHTDIHHTNKHHLLILRTLIAGVAQMTVFELLCHAEYQF